MKSTGKRNRKKSGLTLRRRDSNRRLLLIVVTHLSFSWKTRSEDWWKKRRLLQRVSWGGGEMGRNMLIESSSSSPIGGMPTFCPALYLAESTQRQQTFARASAPTPTSQPPTSLRPRLYSAAGIMYLSDSVLGHSCYALLANNPQNSSSFLLFFFSLFFKTKNNS